AAATAHVGTYPITGAISDGTALASDYVVTLQPGTLMVKPRALTYQIHSDHQTYGTPADLAHDLPGSIATGVNGETLAISYTSSGDTSTAHAGSYDITGTVTDGSGLLTDYDVTVID